MYSMPPASPAHAAVAPSSATAGETPRPAPAARVQMSAAQLFALAQTEQVAGRFREAETIFRALARDPDPEVRAEARFRLGLMLGDLRRDREAAIVFRQLLDEKPNAARVRLELARVLARMGDPDAARRQVRQAQAAGLPPDVAIVVDQLASALRSRKRFGGSVEIALAPDTNINRATSATTLDTIIAPLTLDGDARAQSGVGLRLAGQGYARVAVADHVDLLGRASVGASLYGAHRFDDVSVSLAAGPDLTFSHDRLQPSLVATRRYYGGAFYARTEGGSIDWTHALGRRAQLAADVSASRSTYKLNSLQDGFLYDGAIALERAFTAKLGGSLTLSATRQTAVDPGYATSSGGASLLAWRDLGPMTVSLTAAYRHLTSDARLFLYPRARSDDYVRVSVASLFRKLAVAGLAPLFRVSWERNASTVGIYDFRRLSVETGIARAF